MHHDDFIGPGLIVMAMMQNAFANASFSLLVGKIQGNIVDYLMPPLSTGELIASSVKRSDLAGELARLKPGEVLAGDDIAGDSELRRLVHEARAALTPCPRAHFDSLRGERALKTRLGVAALDAFGEFTRTELAALAGLLTYVEITQVGKAPLLRPPRVRLTQLFRFPPTQPIRQSSRQ